MTYEWVHSSTSEQVAFLPRRNLLIVDDEAEYREILADVLREDGFDVFTVGDADAALCILSTMEPDLIILDFMMPGMNGLDLLGRMRADPDFIKIPIIFSSATVSSVGMTAAVEAGASAFMEKPVTADKLRIAIEQIHPWGSLP